MDPSALQVVKMTAALHESAWMDAASVRRSTDLELVFRSTILNTQKLNFENQRRLSRDHGRVTSRTCVSLVSWIHCRKRDPQQGERHPP